MATKCYDLDNRQTQKKPVARKVVRVTIPDGQSIGQANVEINGEIHGFVYDVPDLTQVGGTLTFDFLDEDGTGWHQKAAIAENAMTVEKLLPAAAPYRFGFCGTATFKCTASGVQTGAKDVNIIVYCR